MSWEHITPIYGNEINADIDCSSSGFGVKFALVGDFDQDGADEVLVVPDAPASAGSARNDLWVMKFDPQAGAWGHMAPIPGPNNATMQADIDCSPAAYPPKLAITVVMCKLLLLASVLLRDRCAWTPKLV